MALNSLLCADVPLTHSLSNISMRLSSCL